MTLFRIVSMLAFLLAPAVAAAQPAGPPSWLVEMPAAGVGPDGGPNADRLAMILSGDGGWADLDKELARLLQARGVAVLGVDCLKYFWQRRTPEELAGDLGRVLDDYGGRWRRDELVLIGFSFGAGVLPAVVNRLPGEVRDRVALAAMLTSNTWANWEIHVGNWLVDGPDGQASQVVPEARRLGRVPLLCVYGVEEKEVSACPKLADVADVVELPGGHHFDGNYDRLADLVLGRLDARKAGP